MQQPVGLVDPGQLIGVFLPILLPLVFRLDGVLYSFPVADVLTFILSLAVILRVYSELGRVRPGLAMD